MSYNLTLTYALVTKSTEIASNAPSWGIAVMRLQHGRPKDSGFGALDLGLRACELLSKWADVETW